MTRLPRQTSETGIYHVMFRGVNHCHLFEEAKDYEKMLDRLATVKSELSLEVYAFCLMSNHVHFICKEQSGGSIATAMRKLLTVYALWFNRKYQRSGALIANRYKSECVEDDAYLLTLVRYIHQNPVAAGLVNTVNAYQWSSYSNYLASTQGLVDVDFVLGILSDTPAQAKQAFVSFHDTLDANDYSLPRRNKSESQIREQIIDVLGGIEPHTLSQLPRHNRNASLSALRAKGFSVRQIERTTGISRGVIARCKVGH